jgi:hypothetical protein
MPGTGITACMSWEAVSLTGILVAIIKLEYVVVGEMVDSP